MEAGLVFDQGRVEFVIGELFYEIVATGAKFEDGLF